MAGLGNIFRFGRKGGRPSTARSGRGGRRLRPDIDLNFDIPNINLPSLGKPANDNAPKVVNGSMGMFGRSSKAPSTPTGVMPSFRREGASPVSSRDSVEKILATATQYLASIDASLKAQVLQQQYAYNQSQKQQREAAVEAGAGESTSRRPWFTGAFASTAKEEFGHLAKVLGGLGLLYTLINFDDLQQKFGEVITTSFKEHAMQSAAWAGIAGAGALGAAGYKWFKGRQMRKAASDTMLGLYPDEISKIGREGATKLSKKSMISKAIKAGSKGIRGGLVGVVAATVIDVLPSMLGLDPGGRGAAALNILSDTASLAGAGALAGSFIPGLGTVAGGLIGGAAGLAMGMWNYGKQLFTGQPSSSSVATPAYTHTAPMEAYDIVYGNGLFGSPNQNMGKSLTQMTVAEVLAFQKNVLAPNTKGNYNGNDGKKHTPVGAYQFTESTIIGMINSGVIKPSDIFDAATQDRMAESLWNARRGGDLSQTWAYTFGSSRGQFANTPFSSVKNAIISKEVGSLVGMPEAQMGDRQGTPTSGDTYDSVKPMFEKLTSMVGREKMRLMSNKNYDGSPYRTAIEGSRRSTFISEQAKLREVFMRARSREDKQVARDENTSASQKAYSQARRTRSEQTKVPNPAYGNSAPLNMFAHFQVAGRMMA